MCLISTAKLLRFVALTLISVRFRTKTLVTRLQFFKEHAAGHNAGTFQNLEVCLYFTCRSRSWWSLSGSNRRPPACKASALPAELRPQETWKMVGLGGLEPPASPLSGVRSNHLSYRPSATEPQNLYQLTWNTTFEAAFDQSVSLLTTLDRRPSRNLRGSDYVKYRCLVWTSCARELATRHFLKGGDPAAPSDTATLLRLHPSHEPLRGRRPPCG